MRKPTIKTRCPAAAYAGQGERIAEFAGQYGGGLISIHDTDDGRTVIEVYRCDAAVTVRGGSSPRIRFIVDTYVKYAPGTSYYWSRVTSTVTGRSLEMSNVGGAQNTSYEVKRALGDTPDAWNTVWSSEHEVRAKNWHVPKTARFAGDVTGADFLALERPE